MANSSSFDSLSPEDKRNAYANAIVQLKQTNDPRFPEAKEWYRRTYMTAPVPTPADLPGHPLTYDEYYATQAQPDFLGTKWKPASSYLMSMADTISPPTPQELLSRPYVVPPMGGGKTLGGATVTQDAILGGLVQERINDRHW